MKNSAYKSIQITNKDKLFEKNKKLLSLEKLDQKYTSSILKISDLQDWFLKEVGKMDTEIEEIKEETDRFREESKEEMEMMAEELGKAKERARMGKNGY
mmetsp:Transcript_17803/g.17514  ORF Transcript_17803/g.17514 Transcript_17803/m.17514 type:complete len:99 (+) Transcript_17803:1663-1959(+)|eukprot:CAMPEP_0197001350 /NCGR_PEP_ID=MMETSP1380-20130617/6066_1 /TAXON_ID=5936 /ORGANISM="Euplotes crassus, Strain CT5" /LENGTH=98 /DNA_ID=CAMNT_0042418979 /DNA_START=1650 /DNA_END=1946 /DNA_ORIENTATION=+